MIALQNQKLLTIISAVVMLSCAVFFLPVISRAYNDSMLLKATQIILIHGLFGAFEFLRPVFISNYHSDTLSVKDFFLASGVSFLVFAPILYVVLHVVFSEHFSFSEHLWILMAFYFYVVYNCIWPFLDKDNKTGLAMLIRSLATFFIYSILAVFSLYKFFNVTFALILSHGTVLGLFYLFGYKYIKSDKIRITKTFVANVFQVIAQNAFKVLSDFFDRVLLTISGASFFSAVYNLFYDLASKSNSPIQLLALYSYPKMQVNQNSIKTYFGVTFFFAICLSVLSILMFELELGFVSFYFGEGFDKYKRTFYFLTSVFALYAFSAILQPILRATNRYKLLTVTFVSSTFLGVSGGVFFYYQHGIYGVLVGVVLFKIPAVIVTMKVLREIIFGKMLVASYVIITLQTFIPFYMLLRIVSEA